MRDVRRRSTLGFAEHITPSGARLYHACISKHITRDEVALYHDGNAVHITALQKPSSISLRVSGHKGEAMAKTSHELAIEFAVEITELCSKIKCRPKYTK